MLSGHQFIIIIISEFNQHTDGQITVTPMYSAQSSIIFIVVPYIFQRMKAMAGLWLLCVPLMLSHMKEI